MLVLRLDYSIFLGNMETKTGMRSVATFDAIVGFFVLALGMTFVWVMDEDLLVLIERALNYFHIGLSHSLSQALFELAAQTSSQQMGLLGLILIAYAVMRLTEAYGLWYERRWGAKLAILVCGLSVPLEIYEEFAGVTLIKTLVLLVNVWIVMFMVKALRENASN